MKKKVLVIVAHPDDETIWMGGFLIRNISNWNLTILSLCRKDDLDRAPKFQRVCSSLGAECFISDLEDETLIDIDSSEVINRIKKYCDKSYDYIFTHGSNGEYGHKRHKDVNDAVLEMVKKKDLSAEKVFLFSYEKKGKSCYPSKKAEIFINLKDKEVKIKKKMIENMYGFTKDSFESLSCRDIESFQVLQ
ncbi:MAG: PIG-L family deacetylase [Candidatus Woesearchaeota archaeon]